MDAISDKGLHSYLQHHWVIMKLMPATSDGEGSEGYSKDSEDSKDREQPTSRDPEADSRGFPVQLREEEQEPKVASGSSSHPEETSNIEDSVILPDRGSADLKRQRTTSNREGEAAPSAVGDASDKTQECDISADSIDSNRANQPLDSSELKLSTEQQLSLEQTKQLQPPTDNGLELADSGRPWFLRIDRQASARRAHKGVVLFVQDDSKLLL